MRFGILLTLVLVSCKSPEVDSEKSDIPAELSVVVEIDTNDSPGLPEPTEDPTTVNSDVIVTDPNTSESSANSEPERQIVVDPFGPSSAGIVGDDDCDGAAPPVQRRRLNNPIFNDFHIEESADIVLILTIDDEGNIISASHNKLKTTTTNQDLINTIIDAVKKQVKYSKDPGAPLTKVSMHVKIKPQ